MNFVRVEASSPTPSPSHLHRDNDLGPGGTDEIHGTAHALDHLARNDPIREVTARRYLHAPEDGEPNLARSNHAETVRRRKG